MRRRDHVVDAVGRKEGHLLRWAFGRLDDTHLAPRIAQRIGLFVLEKFERMIVDEW